MQDHLLDLLKENKTVSTTELAYLLHTSTEMVEARLERYESLEYIKKTVFESSECGGVCKKCHGCSKMSKKTKSVIFWERGEKLLTK